jgi:lipoprotein-anchoring transpeptidase ErfK/SrfK
MTDRLLNPLEGEPASLKGLYLRIGGAILAGVLVLAGLIALASRARRGGPEDGVLPPSAAAAAAALAPTNAPAPSAADAALLEEVRRLQAAGDLLTAREKGLAALEAAPGPGLVRDLESLLGQVNIDLVFSPRAMPEKVDYTVAPGDSLDRIARKFGTTVDLIRRGNGVRGSLIRAGDRLRVLQAAFAIRVDKSDNTLVLRMNDRFFKRYSVGTGQYNKTPVGDFKILEKIPQPTWWRPDGKAIPYGDTNNLLGTHWMSIDAPGYGIHGTWEPDTIGKQASLGCIRLLNDDVEQLFTLVTEGTPVAIQD